MPQMVIGLVTTDADWIDLVYWRGSAAECEVRRLYRRSTQFDTLWNAMRDYLEVFCNSVMYDIEPTRPPWLNHVQILDAIPKGTLLPLVFVKKGDPNTPRQLSWLPPQPQTFSSPLSSLPPPNNNNQQHQQTASYHPPAPPSPSPSTTIRKQPQPYQPPKRTISQGLDHLSGGITDQKQQQQSLPLSPLTSTLIPLHTTTTTTTYTMPHNQQQQQPNNNKHFLPLHLSRKSSTTTAHSPLHSPLPSLLLLSPHNLPP